MFYKNRNFRFCIPGFRYGSGVRFELWNPEGIWRVRFFYGSSKNIVELQLDGKLLKQLSHYLPKKCFPPIPRSLSNLTSERLQKAWIGEEEGHPFDHIDALGVYGEKILIGLNGRCLPDNVITSLLSSTANRSLKNDPNRAIAGMIAGIIFNSKMESNESK